MSRLLQGSVNLPGSKSESNRALMIAAYGGFPLEVEGLSEAHDTVLLQELLAQIDGGLSRHVTVDCEDAGTVARFMMTFLAGKPGEWMLTGTERLCERPMAPLIGALRQLGSEVECLCAEGCLPVRIHGKKLRGGRVTLDASQSSQFASSLLMAAPTWDLGLQLTMTGNPVSLPYLEMTLAMMKHFGIHIERRGDGFTVAPQTYRTRPFTVSADWSAASYWYELLAVSDGGGLLLRELKTNSLQGDSKVADMFARLGVKTEVSEDGVWISKSDSYKLSNLKPIIFNINNTPDLFPSVFVTCVAMNISAIFKGISTLYNKESDRINSLVTELSKIYTLINIVSDDEIMIKKSFLKINQFDIKKVVFDTCHDHRIAMSLAVLGLKLGVVSVDDQTIVNKSYPGFWEELKKFL